MKLPQAHLTTLPNGLRLVCLQYHGVGAGVFGITVGAGSADEGPDTTVLRTW